MDPHQDRTSDDSDSAPEDVAFQDAKNDALAHLRTVSDAVKEKKKMRKESRSRSDILITIILKRKGSRAS